jgi:hypothetical protein
MNFHTCMKVECHQNVLICMFLKTGIRMDFFCSKILNQEPTIKTSLSPEASDLIHKLLVKNYQRRLGGGTTGSQAVKEHSFFKVSSLPHHVSYLTVLSCVLFMVPCAIHTFWRFSVLFLKDFVLTFQ